MPEAEITPMDLEAGMSMKLLFQFLYTDDFDWFYGGDLMTTAGKDGNYVRSDGH